MTIEDMETVVQQERAAVAALHAKVSDSLKDYLQQATFWLDDVEGLFLGSARKERRTPDQLQRWLSYATAPLEWAIRRRKHVEEILAKHGPKVELVGNG